MRTKLRKRRHTRWRPEVEVAVQVQEKRPRLGWRHFWFLHLRWPLQDGRTRNVQNLSSYSRLPQPISHHDLRKRVINVVQTSVPLMSHHDLTRGHTRLTDIQPSSLTHHHPRKGSQTPNRHLPLPWVITTLKMVMYVLQTHRPYLWVITILERGHERHTNVCLCPWVITAPGRGHKCFIGVQNSPWIDFCMLWYDVCWILQL